MADPTQFNLVDVKRFVDNDFTQVYMSIGDRVIDTNYAADFSVDADFQVETLPILGTKEDPQIVNSVTVPFTLTEYVVNSVMPKIVSDYMEFGTMPEISFLITQNDPKSLSGTQTIYLGGVTLSNIKGLLTASAAGQHATRGVSGTARIFRLVEGFSET